MRNEALRELAAPRSSRRCSPWRRALRPKALVIAILAMGIVVGTASSASAHAILEQSEPAAGSVLPQPPDAVVLHFSEPVETQLGSVKVLDGTGHVLQTSPPKHSDGNRTVRVGLPKLDNGTYIVSWRVVSADSHPVGATFTFSVGPPGTRPAAVSTAAGTASSDRSVGIGFGVVRFAAFASLAMLIGAGLLVVWMYPAAGDLRSVKRLLAGSWAVALGSSLLGVAFQGAYAAGGPLGDVVQPALWSEVARTEFGRAWLARTVILALIAVPLLVLVRRGARQARLFAAAWTVLLAALVLTVVAAGHAITGRWVLLAIGADVVHVGAMSFWLGGLAVLFLAMRAVDPAGLRDLVPRFSRAAFVAVALIVGSGIVQSWRQLGSFGALTSSTYGRLLLVKVALVAVLIGLAGLSRRLVLTRLRGSGVPSADSSVPLPVGAAVAEPGDLRARLRRTVLGEVAMALVVLGVTAGLVNAAPPPPTVSNRPFDAQLTMGTLQADVVIDPPRVGQSALHVYLATADGQPANVAEVTAELTQPPAVPTPIAVTFTRITQNHFVANSVLFPFAGKWSILLKARIGEFDEETASLTVRIG